MFKYVPGYLYLPLVFLMAGKLIVKLIADRLIVNLIFLTSDFKIVLA